MKQNRKQYLKPHLDVVYLKTTGCLMVTSVSEDTGSAEEQIGGSFSGRESDLDDEF